ncbi:MAG: hypothetical protein DI547_04965 [Sphingobium sp.]|nr:MAG: hypothetical protein DI547_04965 [Sphingobium sp.]
MAFLSQQSALALTVESTSGVFNPPSASADIFPVANLRPQIEGITTSNPEYLGTIHAPGDFVIGSKVSISFSITLRPPGGAAPPVAGAFIPGRVLRAGGFTETILSAAVPVAPEAIGGSPTTSTVTLGSSAAATAQLYKGLALLLSDNGAAYRNQLTAIRNYTAGKVATLAEVLGAAPGANYQIPKQLAYVQSGSEALPTLSASFWMGQVRYDCVGLSLSSMRFNFPVSTRDATEYPMIECTLEGDIYAFADETAPVIGALGGIPTFKDGDFWIANKALGGSQFSVDMGIRNASPPNPNKASGNDAAQLVGTKRTASITLNHRLKSDIDFYQKAIDQSYHALWAQYGYTAGAMVGFLIPNGRFNYPNPDNSGEFVTQAIDMLIDDAAQGLSLYFPY